VLQFQCQRECLALGRERVAGRKQDLAPREDCAVLRQPEPKSRGLGDQLHAQEGGLRLLRPDRRAKCEPPPELQLQPCRQPASLFVLHGRGRAAVATGEQTPFARDSEWARPNGQASFIMELVRSQECLGRRLARCRGHAQQFLLAVDERVGCDPRKWWERSADTPPPAPDRFGVAGGDRDHVDVR